MLFGLLIVTVLIAANGFFVAVEFALVAADRNRLEARAEDSRRARVALEVIRRLSFHLSGAQLGITVTSLLLGFVTEPVASRLVAPVLESLFGLTDTVITVIVGLVLATILQMVLGELIPKNVAIARAESAAMTLAPAARIVDGALSPLIWMFNGAANWMVRRLGIEPKEELTSISTLEELEYLIRSSGATGEIEPDALSLLTRTLRFADKTAADALTPRVHTRFVEADALCGQLIALAAEFGFSRYPVIGADVDDVVGLVDVVDLLDVPAVERANTPIAAVTRTANFIPETKDLAEVFSDFDAAETNMLMVLDEHGGFAGVLTVEDVLEEIVGEVDDEYDEAEVLTAGLAPGTTVVAGTLHGDEVEEASGFEMPEGEYETIAGFVLAELGRIPTEGETLVWEDWRLEVVAMDHLRIASIELTRLGVDRSATEEPSS